jgi:hypothetical protein
VKFAYRNTGTGLSWAGGPPTQTGGGDKRSLGAIAVPSRARGVRQELGMGSLGGTSLDGHTFDHHTLQGTTIGMPMPRPGAPEPLAGCACSGGCHCKGALGDTGAGAGTVELVIGAAALYLAYKHFKKRRR